MQKPQYKSNSELKYLARINTSQHLGLLLGTLFLKSVITYFVQKSFSLLVFSDVSETIVSYVLIYILSVFSSILQVGENFIFLKIACNIPSSIKDLFYGFGKNMVKIIKLGSIMSLIVFICYIPYYIAFSKHFRVIASFMYNTEFSELNSMTTFNNISGNNYIEPYSVLTAAIMQILLFMVVCNIISLILTLPFFPVFYMVIDFPDWNMGTILKRSFEVMQGNKLRLLLLYISFIPLYMLSFFTCGLPLIWVVPYVYMTETNFYLDLMTVRNKSLNSL